MKGEDKKYLNALRKSRDELPFGAINELSKRLQVGTATINRFFRNDSMSDEMAEKIAKGVQELKKDWIENKEATKAGIIKTLQNSKPKKLYVDGTN